MATLENYRNEIFVTLCHKSLSTYTQSYRGIEMSLLATSDGFEITSYSNKSNHGADKIAAVGSSLFALGMSLVNEFDLRNCKSMILDSEKGKVYISSISNMNDFVILMVQTSEQATLGNIIYGAKRLNEEVISQLTEITK